MKNPKFNNPISPILSPSLTPISIPFELTAYYYGFSSFCFQINHNIFIFYYMILFLDIYKMNSYYFYIAQLLFLIWNSFNDLIIGYIIDIFTTSKSSVGRRIPALKYGGPLCAFTFWLIWLPIGCIFGDCNKSGTEFEVFIFFLLTTFLYDGVFTYLSLSHSAILADVTSDPALRALCNRYNALFAIAASFSVIFGTIFWSVSLNYFRVYVTILSIGSAIGIVHSSKYIVQHSAHDYRTPDASSEAVLPFFTQVASMRSFQILACIGFLQQFMCSFNNNFWLITYDILLGSTIVTSEISSWFQLKTLLVAIAFISPHLMTIQLTPYFQQFGVVQVLNIIFQSRIVSCLLALLLYLFTSLHLVLFLVVNRVLTELVCRTVPLITALVIDEDFLINKRDSTRSSSITGCLSLVNKPAVSLAPMFGWMVLNHFGYKDKKSNDVVYKPIVWLLIGIPILFVILQYFLWMLFPKSKQIVTNKENERELQSLLNSESIEKDYLSDGI